MSAAIDPSEVPAILNYLKKLFKHEGFTIKIRDRVNDSVEVNLDNEFIGVIYKDVDEGETSYNFTMTILDMDLERTSAY